jgi:pimeloyl-ACP methyl ester carboxylesterase
LLAILALTGLASLSAIQPDVTCHDRSAPAQGGEIAYRDCGDRAARPILLIPGGPGLDARYMMPLAAMIVPLRYRVIVLEPRGTGASRPALGDGTRLTVAGSIADVEAVRRAAGVEKAVILGHSFGGEVAQAYAAAFPDRVRSLVLLDSAGPGLPSPGPADSWRRRGTPDEVARYDALRGNGDRIGAMRIKFRLSFFHKPAGERFLASLPDDAMHMDVMPLAAAYARDFHLAAPARGSFPVTLVAGEIDWIRAYEPTFKVVYPHARLLVVPKAGHFPWADAPRETRRALGRALAD